MTREDTPRLLTKRAINLGMSSVRSVSSLGKGQGLLVDATVFTDVTLDVGAVLANEIPTFRAEHMPYDGVKDSGVGRECVRYAMEEMTGPKLLVLNLQRPLKN